MTFSHDFEVENYLKYRSGNFVQRFDANSYLYISKSLDYFDLSSDGKLTDVFAKAKGAFFGHFLYFGLAVSVVPVQGNGARA